MSQSDFIRLFKSENIYDSIKNSIQTSYTPQNPKEIKKYKDDRIKNCHKPDKKKTQEQTQQPKPFTLSCESGKLLKYILRLETKTVNKKKKKKKESNVKSNIIRKYDQDQFYIDTKNLNRIINAISNFLKDIKTQLESCKFLVTVDMESITEILKSEIINKAKKNDSEANDSETNDSETNDEKNNDVKDDNNSDTNDSLFTKSKKKIENAGKILWNARNNPITTLSNAFNQKDKDTIILATTVVLITVGIHALKNTPVAGQVAAAIGISIVLGIIAYKKRKYHLYGSSTIKKETFLENLEMFEKKLTEFKNDIQKNVDSNKNNTNIYINKFCVTSFDEECIEKDNSGKKIKKIKKMNHKDKQFIKGIFKFMKHAFQSFILLDNQTETELNKIDVNAVQIPTEKTKEIK
jgi:hypothetical protein